MSDRASILAFAGSARKDSYNKKLVRIAASGAKDAGAEVTVIDLADYPLPIFNEDDERKNGPPEQVVQLKKISREHDGFLIASPEYNSSISALLKNTIDWISRPAANEPPLAAFKGKSAVLMSASPGALGGLRGLVHLRAILGNIGVIVVPDQIALPLAAQAFDADDQLKDEKRQASIRTLGETLATFTAKMKKS